MQAHNRRALIVGGGIAGPALALFLTRAGFNAAVYEARAETGDTGAALGLAPNGMNVLAELGLAGRVIAAGTIMDRSAFRSVDGTPIGATPDTGRRFGQPGVTLSRATLHRILLDAAADAGVSIHFGKRLTMIRETDAGVTAVFSDGSEAGGDFLVGADGINSRVREIILPDGPRPEFTGLVGPGGFVPRSAIPERGDDDGRSLVLYMNSGAFFGYGHGDRDAPDGSFWWTAMARAEPMTEAERDATTLADVRAFILGANDSWDPAVGAILDATTRYVPPINIFDVATLPRWSKGRTVLIGDAAHAVSPHSGQGASLALEDAIVLAKMLRDDRRPAGLVVEAFERARRDRVERIVAFGRKSGNSKKKQGPVAAWMMRLLMPVLIRLVGRMQKTAYGYRVRWEDDEGGAERRAA